MKGLWIIMAFISGAMLPVQAGLNARMGKSIESSVYAALISFVVGAVGLSLYIVQIKPLRACLWNFCTQILSQRYFYIEFRLNCTQLINLGPFLFSDVSLFHRPILVFSFLSRFMLYD